MLPPHLAKWTEAGDLVFVSGQLPFDADRTIRSQDIAAQTTQTLANLKAVLREAGLQLSDVAKTTVWLRNASDFAGFNEAYAAYFGDQRPGAVLRHRRSGRALGRQLDVPAGPSEQFEAKLIFQPADLRRQPGLRRVEFGRGSMPAPPNMW
jgi:2-iminobutanoate/2-iminopropanoate deaminase